MKVMNPYDVIRTEELFQCRRKSAVHRPILVQLIMFELHQIHAVVQKWPQALIGVTFVEAVQFFIRHVNSDDVNTIKVANDGLDFSGIRPNVSTPAKPSAAGRRKRFTNGHRKAARLAIALGIGDAIGNNDEASDAAR